jgi:hypothetical protein
MRVLVNKIRPHDFLIFKEQIGVRKCLLTYIITFIFFIHNFFLKKNVDKNFILFLKINL